MNDSFMAPISCLKKKYEGKKIEVGEKKKARSGIHLIKTDHGVTKGGELTEILIQPLDRKTKTKRELSTMVRDIHKPTHQISI